MQNKRKIIKNILKFTNDRRMCLYNTRTGYIFQSFKSSDGKTYEAGVKYPCDFESLILTAQWNSDEKTVTFIANGTQYDAVEVLNGSVVTKPAQDPVKTGHTFKGWSTKQGEFAQYDFNGEVTDTLALYASFTPNVYAVTVYDENGNVVQTEKAI